MGIGAMLAKKAPPPGDAAGALDEMEPTDAPAEDAEEQRMAGVSIARDVLSALGVKGGNAEKLYDALDELVQHCMKG